MSLSNLFSRRSKDDAAGEVDVGRASVHPTKALSRFVQALGARPHPVVLDLGPVVGANVAFFGEQFGCKIIVEDLAADLERHVAAGTVERFAAFLAQRFPQPDASIDGILCWDVFDYLDRESATALAAQLGRLLRPDGMLFALFGTAEPRPGVRLEYTKHVVVDGDRIEYRPYDGSRGRQRPIPNREIQELFEPLRIADQFLLKANMREVLLRRAAHPSDGASSRSRS